MGEETTGVCCLVSEVAGHCVGAMSCLGLVVTGQTRLVGRWRRTGVDVGIPAGAGGCLSLGSGWPGCWHGRRAGGVVAELAVGWKRQGRMVRTLKLPQGCVLNRLRLRVQGEPLL